MQIHNELAGEYELNIKNPETGETREFVFHNVITDIGLNSFGSYSGEISYYQLRYCRLGTGSTPPAFTDTQLVGTTTTGREGTVFSAVGQLTTSPYYAEITIAYTFDQGSVVGNMSEIGIFTSDDLLFSRALIKEINGNPTTITVTAIEQVTVKYKLRSYFSNHIAGTGTVNITYNSVTTPYNYTLYRNPIPAGNISYAISPTCNLHACYKNVTSDFTPATSALTQPNGDNMINDTAGVSLSDYVQNSFYLDTTVVIESWEGNHIDGIKSVGWGTAAQGGGTNYYKYHIAFSPSIPKTSTDKLTLVVRTSWGRV